MDVLQVFTAKYVYTEDTYQDHGCMSSSKGPRLCKLLCTTLDIKAGRHRVRVNRTAVDFITIASSVEYSLVYTQAIYSTFYSSLLPRGQAGGMGRHGAALVVAAEDHQRAAILQEGEGGGGGTLNWLY